MSFLPRRALGAAFLALCFSPPLLGQAKGRFADALPPVPAEELAVKEDPKSPGTRAILLYRAEHIDVPGSFETIHLRIKVLTDKGFDLANVELPYVPKVFEIKDIQARTVGPDGAVRLFNGTIYDKLLVKARGFKVHAKVFTLPDIRVGTIIEYRVLITPARSIEWRLQHASLFTRRASFTLRPPLIMVGDRQLLWIYNTPQGKRPEFSSGLVRLDLQHLPPATEEDYLPPPNEHAYRVKFFVGPASGGSERFWQDVATRRFKYTQKFMDRPRAMQGEAARLLAPGDSPDTKLRKLYARAEQLRYLSYERERTLKEEKRENLKKNAHVEDILKRGYASGNDVNLFFVALARAAGFEASYVLLGARNNQFFSKNIVDETQLDAAVAMVRLNGSDLYFDPASRFCPYGMLPWEETNTPGLRLISTGGEWIMTPSPRSSDALTQRSAALRLTPEGVLEGTLTLRFTGQEAYNRRVLQREADEPGRRKDLEEEVKKWLPASSTVELTRMQDWDKPDAPLEAEFKLRIPDLTTSAGRRLLLPVSVLSSQARNPFQHAQRQHSVYFRYPFQTVDEVTIELPDGLRPRELAGSPKATTAFSSYELSVAAQEKALRIERRLQMDRYYFSVVEYGLLRAFYDRVHEGDTRTIVLEPAD